MECHLTTCRLSCIVRPPRDEPLAFRVIFPILIPLGSRLCKPTADTHSYVHSLSHGYTRAYGVRSQRHRGRVRCS